MVEYLLNMAEFILGRLLGALMILGVVLFLIQSARSAIGCGCKECGSKDTRKKD